MIDRKGLKLEIETLALRAANLQSMIDLTPELETANLAMLEYVQAKLESLRDVEIMSTPGSLNTNGEFRSDIQNWASKEPTPGFNNGADPSSARESTIGDNKESDPLGTGVHEPGAKLDAGKQRSGLFVQDFARAIAAVVRVVTFGADKYSKSGWLKVPDADLRYKDAMYRHLFAMETEENDPDSGYPHLAHAAWNVLALLELRLRRAEGKNPEWTETG